MNRSVQSPEQQRLRMIDQQLRSRKINDSTVLAAMERVPRHCFVPPESQHLAHSDQALPLAHGQTISQPYIVALMTQLVMPAKSCKVLDVGTGSGYQAAVLAELTDHVYSIEIVQPLAQEAATRLDALGYKNVTVRHGDGYRGWPEQAPFDIIVVAAAPDHVPQPLIDQLAPGGRLVLPVGSSTQHLILVEKDIAGTATSRKVIPVAFGPMTGEAARLP